MTTTNSTNAKSTVKRILTPECARPAVENSAYAAFSRRVIAAAGRRVAGGDVDALPELVALAAAVDEAIGQAVAGLRVVGYSWAEIAARLGVSRQAAHQRWAIGPAETSDQTGVAR